VLALRLHNRKRINIISNMIKIERSRLNTDLLTSFVTIADCGNLTVAAGRLHRTQSAISVQIRKLEADLGATLFNRNSRGMALTDSGKLLLPKARSILTDIKEAGALFEAPLKGSIRVGIPDDFNDRILEQILTDFARSHPNVDVVALSGCTSGYPAAVRNGEIDIAVFSGPEDEDGMPLGIEKTVWAAKKGTQIESTAPVPLAVLDRNCWWRDLPTNSFSAIGRDYSITFRSSSFASIQAAIRAGFAVGILPISCVCEKMTVLTAAEGFPNLPMSRRSLLIGENAPTDLVNAMAEAIRGARSSRA
jgi:DNA-binding transcriptional LysR family regulator